MWRDAVARDLADAGFEVVATADDGRSAVARTRATAPDVLVLDLNLPGMSGAQVCAALAAAEVPTRILILSASCDHHDQLDAVNARARGRPRGADPHPHPLGERRPPGRAGCGEGGRVRLPGEVRRP